MTQMIIQRSKLLLNNVLVIDNLISQLIVSALIYDKAIYQYDNRYFHMYYCMFY